MNRCTVSGFLEMFYGADSDSDFIGGSVAATEHSVTSASIEKVFSELDSVEEYFDEDSGEWVVIDYLDSNLTSLT